MRESPPLSGWPSHFLPSISTSAARSFIFSSHLLLWGPDRQLLCRQKRDFVLNSRKILRSPYVAVGQKAAGHYLHDSVN